MFPWASAQCTQHPPIIYPNRATRVIYTRFVVATLRYLYAPIIYVNNSNNAFVLSHDTLWNHDPGLIQSSTPEDALGVERNDANWSSLCIHKILTHCLSGVSLFAGAPELFPWYLGHICHLWRSVFISSPCFWDYFTIEVLWNPREKASTGRFERALALVKLCLERTKDHPFSFKFGRRTLHSPYSFQILETLVAHTDRWRTACLLEDKNGLLKKSLTGAKHCLGQLHSLQICTRWASSHDIASDLFQDAPNLTRVHATDFYQLRWSSITVLHINALRYGTTNRFFANLDKMTCPEELVIGGSPLHPDVANTSPIELSSLKIFSADHLRFPVSLIKAALEILYLNGRLIGDVHNARTPLRGVNHLQTLSFDVHNFGDARIIDCTPELVHLILSSEVMSELRSVLQSLASRSTACSLKRISVSNLWPTISEMHNLLTVIKSWGKRQFSKLRSVSVHVNDDRRENIMFALAQAHEVEIGALDGGSNRRQFYAILSCVSV